MAEIEFTGPGGFRSTVTEQRLYSDGTPMIKMADFEDVVTNAHTMILRPKSMAQFVEAMFLVDAISDQGGWIKELILPFVPGARQDRVNPDGDVLFTAWSVAKLINRAGFEQVLVLDPHSPTTPALIHTSKEFPLGRVAAWFDQHHYDGVIAADKGGKTRAEVFAKTLDLPIFYGAKERDVATGKLTGFNVEILSQGSHYLVVDDICDGGGTFIGLGEKIKDQGCTADLYVTHGIFAKGTVELRKVYSQIYATDSREFHNPYNNVSVIPIMKDMEEYFA